MAPEIQTLRLFRRGQRWFAVDENVVATIAEWREPVSLPRSPDSVRGVVSIRGRMLTVLDVALFPQTESSTADGTPNAIIALRGDEQLALAADRALETIVLTEATSLRSHGELPKFVSGVFAHNGSEINVLNVTELFASAMQGRERRQRLF